jgi:hypothetical protein
MKNCKQPINPTPIAGGDNSVISAYDATSVQKFYSGLTKREYFAALAMQGLLARYGDEVDRDNFISIKSIEYADNLLEKLDEK